MQEVDKQCQCAGNCGCGTKPVESFSNLTAGSSVCCGFSSSLESKNQGNTAISSRGVAGSNYLAVGQSGASVVTGMHASSQESAGCCGSPRIEISLIGLNSETVLGFEFESSIPADNEGLEWVMQADAFVGVDNFGFNNENPEQKIEGNAVCSEPKSVVEVIGGDKANGNNDFCCNNQTKVNPTASGSVDVFSGHVSQTTPSNSEELVALVSQEGI